MFKFVVLCAFAAAAVAEPEPSVLYGAPYASPIAYSSVYAPAATTYTKYASSILPAPYYGYTAPLAYSHFIKKRSAPFAYGSYYTPASYIAPAPFATAAYTAPILTKAPFYGSAVAYTAPAHFIKKRSVAALPLASTYIAPATYAATAPLLTSTYTAASPILPASPYIAATPFGYSHFIKKRSAPLYASSYIAPTAYSTQTRFDVRAPLYSSYASPLPYTYSSPLAYSYLYKK